MCFRFGLNWYYLTFFIHHCKGDNPNIIFYEKKPVVNKTIFSTSANYPIMLISFRVMFLTTSHNSFHIHLYFTESIIYTTNFLCLMLNLNQLYIFLTVAFNQVYHTPSYSTTHCYPWVSICCRSSGCFSVLNVFALIQWLILVDCFGKKAIFKKNV